MALWNIRSLTTKTFIVNDLISEYNLDCLFLTETWLNENGAAALIEACPPNYSFSHSFRKTIVMRRKRARRKKGGGTATVFSNALRCTNISFDEFPSFEYHAIRLNCQPPILAVTVYRPPNSSNFQNDFAEFLSIIHANYDNCIISGDFNLHVDVEANHQAKEFTDMLGSMDFTQHITGPTHKRGHTLDLVITKGLDTTITSIQEHPNSDHSCIFFTIKVNKVENSTGHFIKTQRITPAVAEKFEIMMRETTNATPAESDDLVSAFNTKVKSALDILAPLKQKEVRHKRKAPWISPEIKKLKRSCRRAERAWRKTKLHVHFDIFKEHLTTFNNAVRKARTDHFSNLIASNSGNPKVLFSTIDTILNPKPKTDDSLFSSSKCLEFATYFKDKITDIRTGISQTTISRPFPDLAPPTIINQMNNFTLIDAKSLNEIVSKLRKSTCALDPIPTKFFKTVFDSISEDVLAIINRSLDSGVFPTSLKTALVKPLLKKNNLDPLVLSNFRPISNLPFLSKILEKVVFKQLNTFLNANVTFDKFQSGFRANHSTETALVKVVNDLRINMDARKLSVLVLLDLSAAFDTVDHNLLIERLENWVGLSGPVLNWLRTYLTNREYFVALGDHSSEALPMACGVPQGSILGPLLFSLYMLPLGNIIRKHNINYHSYADDTQIYISVTPHDFSSINTLVDCINDLNIWMSRNFLKLNQDKTEVLIIGNKTDRERLSTHLKSVSLNSTNQAKSLGVVVDSDLNFESHINSIIRSSFYHLRNIAKVKPFLSPTCAETLVHAFVSSRLDYCNALFSGLPKKAINRLQLVQNAAARILTRTKRRAHITPVLKSLHWLPISSRIDYKILLLVYKSLCGCAPQYISDMLQNYTPGRVLRSSGTKLLVIPGTRTKKHGKAAFSAYAPSLWNSLPVNLRMSQTLTSFKRGLKSHLFSLAYSL